MMWVRMKEKKEERNNYKIPDHERHRWSVQPHDRPEVGQLRATPNSGIHYGFPVTSSTFKFV
jgi:hypothetical protein